MQNKDFPSMEGCHIVYLSDVKAYRLIYERKLEHHGGHVSSMLPTKLPEFQEATDILVINANCLALWYHVRDDDPFVFLEGFKETKSCKVVFVVRWMGGFGPKIQESILNLGDYVLDEFPQNPTESIWNILPQIWSELKHSRSG